MKKTILASAIALAFGFTGQAMANPTNNGDQSGREASNSQTATATSAQGGNGSPQANEFSTATDNT
ncbi:MAG: hypothetical protein ABIO19_09215, partial [Burkholderiaceae bacterium]